MKIKILLYSLCFFGLSPKMASAQKQIASLQNLKSQVKVMASASPSLRQISLRWGVTDAQAWKLSNGYGFTVERFTVLRDKKMLANPERKLIAAALKPKPLADWGRLAKADNYAAIIAQAIYGDKFEMSGTASNGIANIVAQSEELEQRFGFSLYAADMSFAGAKLAGWGYTDTDIKANEKYFYRIKTAAPDQLLKTDSSGVYIGLSDFEPLPKIGEVAANFGDKSVILSWDYGRLKSYYNAYYIEKSVDNGVTFKRLSDLPQTNMSDKEGAGPKRMYYLDSLNNNQSNYQYRVIGINPFGEFSPYSEVISGKGKELLAFVPNIRKHVVDDKGVLQLQWEFDAAGNSLISGFTLSKAVEAEGPYVEVVKHILPTQRNLSYDKLDAANYFNITAIAKSGEGRTSYPVLVQVTDSIPPAVPLGLLAKVDTKGKVSLSWKANSDKDLLGYKVYRALSLGQEPVPLIDSVWFVNKFSDSLSLKLMNKKAWYAVSAIDQRFNQSAISPLVELKKPSVIPPSPAVITKFKTGAGVVILNWINSSDDDIVSHTIYKRLKSDTAWTLVKTFIGNATNSYSDDQLKAEQTYQYTIEAKNDGGLKTRSELLTLETPAGQEGKLSIRRLYAYPQPNKGQIEIIWADDVKNVKSYQVYRAENGGSLGLWKVVEAGQKALFDGNVKINTSYEYGVMAVLERGAYSEMKRVTVKY